MDLLGKDKPGDKPKEKPADPTGHKASPASWARKKRVIAWRAAVKAAGHKRSDEISEKEFDKAYKAYLKQTAVAKRMRHGGGES